MPNYCPNCGNELEYKDAKFCSECGFSFVGKIDTNIISASDKVLEEDLGAQINIQELGTRLEDIIDRIFKSRGYKTERRCRLKGRSGALNEIDVVARRGNKVIAIECKNY